MWVALLEGVVERVGGGHTQLLTENSEAVMNPTVELCGHVAGGPPNKHKHKPR